MTTRPTPSLPVATAGLVSPALALGLALGGCGDTPERAKLGAYCVENPRRQVCVTYRSDDTTRAFFDAVLGTWTSTCSKDSPDRAVYIADTFTFQKNLKFTRRRAYFLDDKCTQALFTFSHGGEIRARTTTGAFDYLLDIVLLESSLTPDSEVGAASLGKSQTCKKSGWEKAMTVTLDDCAFIYRQGELNEQEFSVKNLEHFTGMKLDLTAKTFLLGDEGGELFIPEIEARPTKTKADMVYSKESGT